MPRYEGLQDEELVALAQLNDSTASTLLICKYKNLVKYKVRAYYLIGADTEDLMQEGMIGLFKAIRDYKSNKISSFKAFAELCVTRQIITAVKTALRFKHLPLNSYVSLNVQSEEVEKLNGTAAANSDESCNPEELIILRETIEGIDRRINQALSSFELKVLLMHLEGHSYNEIASHLSKPVKSIDNALQRIKRKLKKSLQQNTQSDSNC